MGMRLRPLFGLVLIAAFHTTVAGASLSIPLDWNQRDLHLIPDAQGYLRVQLGGAVSVAPPGAPDLPWVAVSVPLATGETVLSWRWSPAPGQALEASARIFPALQDRPSTEGGPVSPGPDATIYGGSDPYPAHPVIYQGTQSRSGHPQALFLVCPFRWDPGSGALSWTPSGTLELETKPQDAAAGLLPPSARPPLDTGPATAPRTSGAARDEGAGNVAFSLDHGFAATEVPSLEGTPVEFVIVTSEDLAPGFNDLVQWKILNGIPTEVRTVEWIYDNYPQGVDNAEKIRLFLRDAYLYWGTRAVLLGGDPRHVPIRYARDWSWNRTEGGIIMATDYYYACLDGSWNANGNSVFGEVYLAGINNIGDDVDLLPELEVGRVPAATLAEVELFVQKYMDYVRNPELGDYMKKVVTMGEVLFDADWEPGDCDLCPPIGRPGCEVGEPRACDDGAEDCINLVLDLQEHGTPGMNYLELYERDYWWTSPDRGDQMRPNAQPLTLARVTAELTDGASIIYHMGHGDKDRWSIGRERVQANVLHNLKNAADGPRYDGLVYAVNCNSAAVDFDCSGTAWLFSPQGGGVAYLGSTSLDFPISARVIQQMYFERWPGDGNLTPGETHHVVADSIGVLVGDNESNFRFLLYSEIFLGDPQMQVWTSIPQEINVTYSPIVALGGSGSSFAIVTYRDQSAPGNEVAGARVCFYKDGDAVAVGYTDETGVVALPFFPKSTGTFQVTATHAGALAFTGTGTVIAPQDAPFLTLDQLSISDTTDSQAGTNGNGNGIIEIGETVAFNLEYSNRGSSEASNASVELQPGQLPPNIQVQILDGTEDLGSLPPDSSATSKAFLVRFDEISGLLPGEDGDREPVPFDVIWTSDSGSRTDHVAPLVYWPDLELYQTQATEISGDINGVPNNGDVYEVSLDLYNRGSGTASALQARLVARDPQSVTFATSQVALTEAAEHEHAVSAPFRFTVEDSANLGFQLILEDTVSTPPRPVWERLFDLTPPSPPSGLTAVGQLESIQLTWRPPPDLDLWGYRLYRSATSDGTYEPVGVGMIERTADVAYGGYYTDEGLPDATTYFYRVAAVDSSGLESAPGDSLEADTAPGFASGWPISLAEFNANAPTIEQLNYGLFEIVFGTDVLYAFTGDGTDYYDGDRDPSTLGRLSETSDGYAFPAKPAVVDLDGDGNVEIIAVSEYANPDAVREGALCVFDRLGNLKWRKVLASSIVLSSPAVGDLDGDGSPEIVVLANRSVFAFHADGLPVGTANALRVLPEGVAWWLYGSVALADVWGPSGTPDGKDEIIFTTRDVNDDNPGYLYILRGDGTDVPNFPYNYSSAGSTRDGSNASPAVADIDGDGEPEIFIASRARLWMFDLGTPEGNWSHDIGRASSIELNSSPALGDLDRDGKYEVVVGGAEGRLYVLDALTGDPLTAFTEDGHDYLQVGALAARMGSPVLGDLTGDNKADIFIGDNSGLVYGYQYDGSKVRGFPYDMGGEITTGLAIWDVDKNHTANLVIQSNKIQQVAVLDFPNTSFDFGNPDLEAYPWPQFRHDSRNTGVITTDPVTPVLLQAPVVTSTGGLSVELQWLAPSGLRTFRFYRRTEAETAWTLIGEKLAGDLGDGTGSYRWADEVPEAGAYVYRIGAIDLEGVESLSPETLIRVSEAPLVFQLYHPRPNPFGPHTTIRLDLPRDGRATLKVLDPAGRVVRTLMDGPADAGIHTRTWDGRDDEGHSVGSGIYFVRASAEGLGQRSEKLIYLK